ncbi:MAG: monofunctional biosynthetic peptidoglycan transglycosylase, partial [Alphaproteobacteria bacterium]
MKKRVTRWLFGAALVSGALVVLLVLLFRFVNPPTGVYMFSESRRLGGVQRDWVPLNQIAPVMARSAVAAEDANFCNHWGFDMEAIRTAIENGSERGASTISQQTVKNVYLWHGRSWIRKAMEAGMTPLVEALWPKRRIIEVYLNVAEFDEGVFGVGAAAPHYFGVSAAELSATQAAR